MAKLNDFHKRFIFLLVLLALVLSGCGSSRNSKNEDPVLNAYLLIDSQRTDEAIELLENSLVDDPNNYEYQVVLASAYAHKAGIKIQKFVPIINQSERLKASKKKKLKADPNQSFNTKMDGTAVKLATLLAKFSSVFEVYAAVPIVSKQQETYLKHAIYILNELGSNIKPADVMYRVILEVVLFKHILAENLIGEFTAPQTKDKSSCQIDLGKVNDSVIVLGKLLIDIYTDLGFSNPKQAKDMKELAEDTAETVSDITMAMTTLTLVDETSHIFLKQAIIQSGFGKIVRCGN